jgi:putative transposase
MSQPTGPDEQTPVRLRWARLRFSIIGQLLASPPEPGELAGRINELASKSWTHPTTGEALRFSPKTIERMYYAARDQVDPLRALERKVPKHAGTHPSVSPELAAALELQYRNHPRWSYHCARRSLGRRNEKCNLKSYTGTQRVRVPSGQGWAPSR